MAESSCATRSRCYTKTVNTCIILASGPSLTASQIDAARRSGHSTLVVNSTYKAMPDAKHLYGGDFLWWKSNMADVTKTFKGKLWCQDSSACARWPNIKRVRGCNREGLGRDVIHLNGNSGTQAINLAYIWGFKRIILLGFDMKLGPGGERHHHPDHAHPMVQAQCFDEWRHKMARVAKDLKAEGIEVLNATPGSALECFTKVDWWDVLG